MYYHMVIIVMCELCKCDDASKRIIVQDFPQETEIPRKQSREDKKYVPIKRNRMPRTPRHHKWTTGRSAVTLHR